MGFKSFQRFLSEQCRNSGGSMGSAFRLTSIQIPALFLPDCDLLVFSKAESARVFSCKQKDPTLNDSSRKWIYWKDIRLLTELSTLSGKLAWKMSRGKRRHGSQKHHAMEAGLWEPSCCHHKTLDVVTEFLLLGWLLHHPCFLCQELLIQSLWLMHLIGQA